MSNISFSGKKLPFTCVLKHIIDFQEVTVKVQGRRIIKKKQTWEHDLCCKSPYFFYKQYLLITQRVKAIAQVVPNNTITYAAKAYLIVEKQF